MAEQKETPIGGIWQKKSGKGTNYISGEITIDGEKIRFVGFNNKFKNNNPKAPDVQLYLSKPMDKSAIQQKPKSQVKSVEENSDDIPF